MINATYILRDGVTWTEPSVTETFTSEGRDENSSTRSADTLFISNSATLHTTVFRENVIWKNILRIQL